MPAAGMNATRLRHRHPADRRQDLGGRRDHQPPSPHRRSCSTLDRGLDCHERDGDAADRPNYTLLSDGSVLVAGGDVYRVEANTRGDPLPSAEVFDPSTEEWIRNRAPGRWA